MQNASAYYLSIVVALVFALLGFFYLTPGVYHPLSADTFGHTTPHLKYAALFWALTVLAIALGRYVRPGTTAENEGSRRLARESEDGEGQRSAPM